MNQQMSESWDLLNQVDEQQYQAATGLRTDPAVDLDYMMAAFDVAFGEFSQVSRQGYYMVMARLDQYDL